MLDWDDYKPYFSRTEFVCYCGCGRADMMPDFMSRLYLMRKEAQFPFVITSGFRCPEYNNQVSSTGFFGPHTHGKAADIALTSHRLYEFWKLAYAFDFTGHGHGERKGFAHIDTLTAKDGTRFAVRPNAWTY